MFAKLFVVAHLSYSLGCDDESLEQGLHQHNIQVNADSMNAARDACLQVIHNRAAEDLKKNSFSSATTSEAGPPPEDGYLTFRIPNKYPQLAEILSSQLSAPFTDPQEIPFDQLRIRIPDQISTHSGDPNISEENSSALNAYEFLNNALVTPAPANGAGELFTSRDVIFDDLEVAEEDTEPYLDIIKLTAPMPPRTRFEELLQLHPSLLQNVQPARTIYKQTVYRPSQLKSRSAESLKKIIATKPYRNVVRHNIVERPIIYE